MGRWLARPWLVLAVTCTGIFIAALDQYVVVTALPGMMADLKIQITELDRAAWIITAYFLGYTAAMPLMGRVSDLYGRRRIYVVSMLLFVLGSIFVALAPNLPWLVGARVVQAVGGGAVVPVAMAIAADVFPRHRRAIALGIIGGVAEAGSVLGPLYGGVLAETLGWRWIFWINIPVGLAVIMLVYRLLRPSPRERVSIDYRGGLLITASLALLVLGLSREQGFTSSPAITAPLIAGAMLCFALFLLQEKRAHEPLINLSMFRSSTFSAANTTNLFVGGALVMALVNIPLMSDTILGTSPLEGGLRLMRLTAMIPVGAVLGGFLCHRLGYRLPTAAGLLLSATGFFLMSRWSLEIADPRMTRDLIICGLGFGLVIAPIATAVINSVKESQKGVASALVTVMRMVGMMVGLSALTSWGMGQFHAMAAGIPLEELVTSPEEITQSALTLFHQFFLVAAVVCLLGLVPTLLMRWVVPKAAPAGGSAPESKART